MDSIMSIPFVLDQNDFAAQIPCVINKGDEIIVAGFAKKGASRITVSIADGDDGKINDKQIAVGITIYISQELVTITSVNGDLKQPMVLKNMGKANSLVPGMQFTISIVFEEPNNAICILNGTYIGTQTFPQEIKSLMYLVVGSDVESVDTLGFVFAENLVDGLTYQALFTQYTGRQYLPTSERYSAESTKDFVALLPRCLNAGDRLTLRGKASNNGKTFAIGLADSSSKIDPSHIQIPLRLHVDLLEHYVDVLVKSGEKTNNSHNTQLELSPGCTWDFTLEVDRDDGGSIHIAIDGSYLTSAELMHELHQMRYLRVSGDIDSVKSLKFEYD